ncbi:MAG: SDR family oxidoreductase [Gammaproteobacteria bacterium]
MFLVAGATGHLGKEICRALTGHGGTVRAMVRDRSAPDAVASLEAMGAQPVVAALDDPDSLKAACVGCDAVVSSLTAMGRQDETIEKVDRAGQLALIAAAAEEGVERFVYVSFSGAIGKDDPLTLAKRAVERTLKHSGMSWTVLRPSYFMESWLAPELGFDHAAGRVRIFGDGEKPISWISLEDVARFAAEAVDSEEARNAVLELGGPEALTPLEAVRVFEQVTGRQFEVEHVPVDSRPSPPRPGTDSREASIAALIRAYAAGDVIPMEDMLDRFDLELTSVEQYARRVAGASP